MRHIPSVPIPRVPVSAFLAAALSYDGIFYCWDGKDPREGLDCSGLVTNALVTAGGRDLRLTHNAQRIYTECEEIEPGTLLYGHLAFYGPDPSRVEHVMIVDKGLKGEPYPFSTFGACGGGRTCTTPEIAKKLGAKCQHRRQVAYRPDLLSVRRWFRVAYP